MTTPDHTPAAPDPQTDRSPDVSIYPGTPYPGMALEHAATLREEWPDGVESRFLTVAWSTVDVFHTTTPPANPGWPTRHEIYSRCTGTGCTWTVDPRFFYVPEGHSLEDLEDYSEDVHQLTGHLYDLKRRAQLHAETCRMIRKPNTT